MLLFVSNPVRYSASAFFRLKMLLLLLLGIPCSSAGCGLPYISLTLWIAVIFASRGIAFF